MMGDRLKGSVSLPGSKSESNRALMIAAYGGFPLEAENLSEAHDTVLLKTLLERISDAVARMPRCDNPVDEFIVDCEDAGSVSRFLMTFLAGREGNWVLTGTTRLRQRPMAPLVEALRGLGADIECLETEGFLPMRIKGRKLKGGLVGIDASQSSQFASSLLMAAPTWECGLQLSLSGDPVSMPYMEMTLGMMERFGVHAVRNGDAITVPHQPYLPAGCSVSPDWSAASYWFEMAALSDDCDIFLKGLKRDDLQGDSLVSKMFEPFGVRTSYEAHGVRLTKTLADKKIPIKPLVFDFADVPDLFPAVFVTCVALHFPAVFQGVRNLSIKESDRIESLIMELEKYYTFINILYSDSIVIEKSSLSDNHIYDKKVLFNTHQDHRIAMSLAPLCLKLGSASFDFPNVVTKSYPMFWDEMVRLLRKK